MRAHTVEGPSQGPGSSPPSCPGRGPSPCPPARSGFSEGPEQPHFCLLVRTERWHLLSILRAVGSVAVTMGGEEHLVEMLASQVKVERHEKALGSAPPWFAQVSPTQESQYSTRVCEAGGVPVRAQGLGAGAWRRAAMILVIRLAPGEQPLGRRV